MNESPTITPFTPDQFSLALHLLSRLQEADARLARVEQRLAKLVRDTAPRKIHGRGRRRRH